ncbi:MAG: LptF/LptG family permease [Candidatus Latescibacterota bacterium]
MPGSRLLDLYLLRRFLLSLSLSVVALLLVCVIIDLTENIDTFIDFAAHPAQVALYYVYHTPYWIVLTLPIAALLGTLFALAGLARHSEITAMKALGLSLCRQLMPVFLAAGLFSAAAFLFTDRVVPAATYRYNTIRDQITSYARADGSRRQVLLQDAGDQLLYARTYDANVLRAYDVSYEQRRDGRLAVRLTARRMQWEEDTWVLQDGWRYLLDGGSRQPVPFARLALASLTLLPEDLARQQKRPEEMSYAELSRYIDRAVASGEDAARHRVDLHLKVSFPLTCFIVVLLGAPLGANARRAGLANSFGLGILICFVFYSCVKAGQALGWNQVVAPWVGAWAANLLFGALSLVLFHRAHT